MITLGLDPHPNSHTIAALDENGSMLASVTISNTFEGLVQRHRFALPFLERRWAIEGAANRFILPFVSAFTRAGRGRSSFQSNGTACRHAGGGYDMRFF